MNRNFDQVLSEMLRLDEECRAHTTRIDEARKNNIELENELDEIEKRVAETTDTTAQLNERRTQLEIELKLLEDKEDLLKKELDAQTSRNIDLESELTKYKEQRMDLNGKFDSKYRSFVRMLDDGEDIHASVERDTQTYLSDLIAQICSVEEELQVHEMDKQLRQELKIWSEEFENLSSVEQNLVSELNRLKDDRDRLPKSDDWLMYEDENERESSTESGDADCHKIDELRRLRVLLTNLNELTSDAIYSELTQQLNCYDA